tara:strand:- start:456 stop:1196 length:741 start_codon:yes stop_codon:yes gene_type:complete
MSYDFKKNIKDLLIEHKKATGLLKEELVGQTKDPSVLLYRVESGEAEGSVMQKFSMTEEDWTRLNPDPFRGEGSTVRVIKPRGECEDFPYDTDDEIEEALSNLDFSNLGKALSYTHIAGDIASKYFKYGKNLQYGYIVASLEGSDLPGELPPRNLKQLESLGSIVLVEFMHLPRSQVQILSKIPPIMLAHDPAGPVQLVQWTGKRFAKGSKKFPSVLAFVKEVIKLIDSKLESVGGLERIHKCLQK